jgi:hypothetical protein
MARRRDGAVLLVSSLLSAAGWSISGCNRMLFIHTLRRILWCCLGCLGCLPARMHAADTPPFRRGVTNECRIDFPGTNRSCLPPLRPRPIRCPHPRAGPCYPHKHTCAAVRLGATASLPPACRAATIPAVPRCSLNLGTTCCCMKLTATWPSFSPLLLSTACVSGLSASCAWRRSYSEGQRWSAERSTCRGAQGTMGTMSAAGSKLHRRHHRASSRALISAGQQSRCCAWPQRPTLYCASVSLARDLTASATARVTPGPCSSRSTWRCAATSGCLSSQRPPRLPGGAC